MLDAKPSVPLPPVLLEAGPGGVYLFPVIPMTWSEFTASIDAPAAFNSLPKVSEKEPLPAPACHRSALVSILATLCAGARMVYFTFQYPANLLSSLEDKRRDSVALTVIVLSLTDSSVANVFLAAVSTCCAVAPSILSVNSPTNFTGPPVAGAGAGLPPPDMCRALPVPPPDVPPEVLDEDEEALLLLLEGPGQYPRHPPVPPEDPTDGTVVVVVVAMPPEPEELVLVIRLVCTDLWIARPLPAVAIVARDMMRIRKSMAKMREPL